MKYEPDAAAVMPSADAWSMTGTCECGCGLSVHHADPTPPHTHTAHQQRSHITQRHLRQQSCNRGTAPGGAVRDTVARSPATAIHTRTSFDVHVVRAQNGDTVLSNQP